MRPIPVIFMAAGLAIVVIIGVSLAILQGKTPDVHTIETTLPSDSLAN